MHSVGAAIGAVYLFCGLFAVTANAITTLLMVSNKTLRNATYIFMIQQGICNCVIAIPLCFYAGIRQLRPEDDPGKAEMVIGYLLTVCWCCTCNFMLLVTLTRWLQLEFTHFLNRYGTRTVIMGVTTFIYTASCIVALCSVIVKPSPLVYLVSMCTFRITVHTTSAKLMISALIGINSIYGASIIIFNCRSLLWIRRTRKRVSSDVIKQSRKGEINLFAQCAITSTTYVAAISYFYYVQWLKTDVAWYISSHLLWLTVHIHPPILNLIINSQLRQRLYLLLHPFKRVSPVRPCDTISERLTNMNSARRCCK